MNFDDIVDMEWMDTHTSASPVIKEEEDDIFTGELSMDDMPLDSASVTSTLNDMTMSTSYTMPTVDQIRQLIDVARCELALRESLPTLVEPSSVPEALVYRQDPESILSTSAPDNTISPESLVKPKTRSKSRRESSVSATDETPSLDAFTDDGIDVAKLSPKERRQLRNKISARNFRVRRKEYIVNLEQQVDEHKKTASDLLIRLGQMEQENEKLRQDVDSLRRQNQVLRQQQPQENTTQCAGSSSPVSTHAPSPLLRPKNNDLCAPNKTNDTYCQDTSILVSSAVIPPWTLDVGASPSFDTFDTYAGALVLKWCLTHLSLSEAQYSNLVIPSNPTSRDLYDLVLQSLISQQDDKRCFSWKH